MTIRYHLDERGGFVCGDTESGVTSYAYPSSTNAMQARKFPGVVAAQMVAGQAWRLGRDPLPYEREYDARNWVKLGGRDA